MDTDEPDEWEQIEADRVAHLAEYHELKTTPSRFKDRLRIRYQCQQADHLLLDVWIDSAGEPWRYQPQYRIPPAREAEESTAEGRAKNKTGNKWNELPPIPLNDPGGGALLQCSHVKQFVPNGDLIALLAEAEKAGKPTRTHV